MRRSAFVLVLAAAFLNVRPVRADDQPVPWSQAETRVGQPSTVEGRVLGIHCSPTSCLLAFDPTFNRFTAVVQAKDFKTLAPEKLSAEYVGRQVRVHGTVQLLDKKPEIVVQRPEDLELVVTQQERAEKREAAQADMADRLEDIVDRLDAMIDRLDTLQARLDQMNVTLEQQSAEISQIAAIQAEAVGQSFATPPEPSYGEPQARPGYEALRTLKRGMTADEVARLVGNPVSSETLPGGNIVWDYGYGRTITFDTRGRTTALSGFPAP
jgi:dsDNA-binding SOS-regulon protein